MSSSTYSAGDRVVITLDTYGRFRNWPGTVAECPAGLESFDEPGIVWVTPAGMEDDRVAAPGFPEDQIAPLAGYFRDSSGEPIEVGRVYWDSNLDLVKVVTIADWPADKIGDANADAYCSPWHRTARLTDGRESHSDSGKWGRLCTRNPIDGRDARVAARDAGT